MQYTVFPDNTTIQGDGTEAHPLATLAVPVNTPTSNIRTVRTTYHVTAPDVANGWADIPWAFNVPFPDMLWTLSQGIVRDVPPDHDNDYSTGDNHSVTPAGGIAEIYVNSAVAQAGDVIILHTIAIHD